jgi:hypothetical protein
MVNLASLLEQRNLRGITLEDRLHSLFLFFCEVSLRYVIGTWPYCRIFYFFWDKPLTLIPRTVNLYLMT